MPVVGWLRSLRCRAFGHRAQMRHVVSADMVVVSLFCRWCDDLIDLKMIHVP